jgi:glycosyltransferase involved in cell wall biosynthesis
MNESCEISIIVPCYKRLEKLERALASIKTACCTAFEIILVDDCQDGSAFEISRKYNARYVWKGGINKGLPHSRNIGLNLARGKYILFLDDDDFLMQDSINHLYEHMSRDVSFTYGNHIFMHQQTNIPTPLNQLTHDDLLVVNQIPVGGYLIEKSTIKYPFDTRLKSHEDWDFILANVDWSKSKHVDQYVVTIDKTENQTTSHQARRRSKFWMDFLYIYTRYPAPALSERRKSKLLEVGLNVGSLDIDNS